MCDESETFNFLNSIGIINKLKVTPLASLEINKSYLISGIRKMKTRYGDRIMMDLNKSFSIFLPSRISVALFEKNNYYQTIENCVITQKPVYLVYLGGKYNEIKFYVKNIDDSEMKEDEEENEILKRKHTDESKDGKNKKKRAAS